MSKKKPKQKRKNGDYFYPNAKLDALPETVKVSVSTTFATRDLIADIIDDEYPEWGNNVVEYLGYSPRDVGMDEILDYCVHQAQAILQDEVSDLSNLVFTDEHGQLIYTDRKFALNFNKYGQLIYTDCKFAKSKKFKKSTKKNSKKKGKTKK